MGESGLYVGGIGVCMSLVFNVFDAVPVGAIKFALTAESVAEWPDIRRLLVGSLAGED
jgi:hypothetical protein